MGGVLGNILKLRVANSSFNVILGYLVSNRTGSLIFQRVFFGISQRRNFARTSCCFWLLSAKELTYAKARLELSVWLSLLCVLVGIASTRKNLSVRIELKERVSQTGSYVDDSLWVFR